ncbi:hypothetical protein FS749_009905 [Ceratobasidium sp. UAMH 11750]|nr:hypothetical protein FS749_009905 [Ceratobasidium sp. UAMH 11750]
MFDDELPEDPGLIALKYLGSGLRPSHAKASRSGVVSRIDWLDAHNNTARGHHVDIVYSAGAASYEAAKAYENHVAENGAPDSHQRAKEILAGFAGAFVDREVETRGLDFIDRERAKRQAADQAQQAYDVNGNNF